MTMKQFTFLMLVFLIGPSVLFAESTARGRYYYDPSDRVMIDSETGKAYGFIPLTTDYILTEIDYIQGTVRPVQSIKLDDKQTTDDFNAIGKGESFSNWVQRVRGTFSSWRRSS